MMFHIIFASLFGRDMLPVGKPLPVIRKGPPGPSPSRGFHPP